MYNTSRESKMATKFSPLVFYSFVSETAVCSNECSLEDEDGVCTQEWSLSGAIPFTLCN